MRRPRKQRSRRVRAARLARVALLVLASARYMAWCRRFVAHEHARATREPGGSGGVNATS